MIFSEWDGANQLFYIDQGNGFFNLFFSIKKQRDLVLKVKSWSFEGSRLYTQAWTQNFDPLSVVIEFVIFWIELPTLPLEYMEMDVVETIANHLGIFVSHDMEFFTNPHKPIRVCVLLNTLKEFPSSVWINSKFGSCERQVFIENPRNVCVGCHLVGHSIQHYLENQDSFEFQVFPPVEKEDLNENTHGTKDISKEDFVHKVNFELVMKSSIVRSSHCNDWF